MRRWVAVARGFVCIGMLSACAGGSAAGGGAGTPLQALPVCSEPPPITAEAPTGFTAPDGAIVQAVTPQDPLTSVTAYIAKTPEAVRQAYESLDGIEVLSSEDEIFEAELLVTDGEHRTYVKATAACQQGSHLLAVVAPEAEAGILPTPAGSPAPLPVPSS